MSNRTPAKRQKKWQAAIITILLLLLLVPLFAELFRRAKLESIVSDLRSSGLPTTSAELESLYRTPKGENASDLVAAAIDAMSDEPEDLWSQLPIVGYGDFEIGMNPLSTAQRTAGVGYLERNAEPLALLHQAATINEYRYPISFDPSVRNDIYSGLMRCCWLLRVECAIRCDAQDSVGAVESIVCALRISNSTKGVPQFLASLNRSFLIRNSHELVAHAIQVLPLDDAQLVQLDEELADTDSLDSLAMGLTGELCATLVNERQFLPFNNAGWNFENGLEAIAYKYISPTWYRISGQSYQCAKLQADIVQQLMAKRDESIDTRRTAVVTKLRDASTRATSNLASLNILGLQSIVEADAVSTAHCRVIRAAVAVARYRLVMSSLPTTLDDLVPIRLDSVPMDPFDGKAIRYLQRGDGFVVYSIDKDNADNGGSRSDDLVCEIRW